MQSKITIDSILRLMEQQDKCEPQYENIKMRIELIQRKKLLHPKHLTDKRSLCDCLRTKLPSKAYNPGCIVAMLEYLKKQNVC